MIGQYLKQIKSRECNFIGQNFYNLGQHLVPARIINHYLLFFFCHAKNFIIFMISFYVSCSYLIVIQIQWFLLASRDSRD